MKTECPLQCRLRRDAANGHVVWAGLPANLDLAFSREHRDEVYAQHLLREQGSLLRRSSEGHARLCVCEMGLSHSTTTEMV
ncbi:hypothetical protein A5660_07850 [Mycobacterium alsense]|uniref:hypothetical protein n=1 Tax=Mycobacterium alsense TaxID=324058 RepID=UPI0008017F69|nr:hypothetical protein [Mycobacterium alsense]OBI96486.1 hypothetical protein A5660_07850 [Mycobacterium alsense]